MTLEEINRRLRKNPYYQGSQAQQEENAGLQIKDNNIIVSENDANDVENVSKNRKVAMYNSKDNSLENFLYKTGKDVKNVGSNLITGIKRGATEFWNYLASQEIQRQKEMADSIKNAFEKNNILVAEDNSIWRTATDENAQKKYIGNIENKILEYDEKINKNVNNTSNSVLKKVSELAPSIGNMVPGIAASAINPVLGTTYFTTSAGGSYLTDARTKGANEEEALKYATALGIAEGTTEMIGVGNLLSAGKKIGKGAIKEALKKYGANIADNFIQESLMEPIQESASQFILGESDWKDIGERMLSSGVDGALTALILDGASSGIASSVNLVKKVKNNQVITQNDINVAKQDLNTTINKISELEQNKEVANKELQLPMRGSSDINNSATNYTNNIKQQNQNISSQKQIAPLNEQAQVKYDSDNFAKQVDAVKNGTFAKRDMLTLGRTPKILQELGLKDLPITMTQKHLDTIMNESGKHKGANYHGLGEDIVKKLPEALNNPLDILKSSTKDDSIVLTTDLSDKQDRTIIASIKIDGKGDINNIRIDTNVMTSAYGRNNYDKFMQENIKAGNLLYDIDQGIIKKIDKKTVGERLQLPMRDSSDSSPRLQLPNSTISINNIIPQKENYASINKRVLNPVEISNSKASDVSTTPRLPNITYKTQKGKNSKFYDNLMSKTDMLNDGVRKLIKNNDDVKYYQGVTNKQALAEAYNRLNEGGARETIRWFSKDLKDKNTTVSATEIAEGWILLKQYQDIGDYESAVSVAKRMRDMGTKSGQALQAFNIQARLTPEGMFHYAQSELQEAFERFSKNKTKEWIDKHKSDFDLKPEETETIINKVKEAQKLDNNSYEKKVKLAEINKIITNKLPPEKGAGIKSWMRISMLFNPKTQVRNVLGNAVIVPVNTVSDFISSLVDNALAKKTGVRTTGNISILNYAKGFIKGLYESYNDFKKGINTRDINGNRFEIGKGKSFKNKGVGKVLNKVDNLLNFMLDAGDRTFYEATFTNSINNQLVLNNTDVVTQDMIDIATNEALSRTWQDNNNYTKLVLSIRRAFNRINIKNYGMGDILIPFAKTPANLTKAIVDYSPIGLVNTIIEGNNVKKAINRGDLTVQQQHKFVQDLGKATAGTMLYVLGYALAKAGITSGESDEDKDVANFMKNNLGTSEYSIKIGDRSFTYDWAQPVSAPFSMMANLVNKSNESNNLLEKITNILDVPMNIILEQSFMQSIQEVLNNNGGVVDGILQQILDLPSRAIPTFLKQITDMVDTTQRTTYEKNKPIQTSINKIKSKIPGMSKQLAPVSNTLGQDIKKYGGETNPFLYAFHTFINPANTNSNQKNKAGIEIYKVYQSTGDKSVFPRQADYSQIIDGNKIILTSHEKYEYQKTAGEYYNKVVNELLKSNTYKKLSNSEKAEILTEIASDSNEKAKEKLAKNKNLEYEREKTDIKVDELVKEGLDYGNVYIYKTQIKDIEGDKNAKGKIISSSSITNQAKYIMNMDTDDVQKDKLLSLLSDTDTVLTVSDLKKLNGEYLTYMQQSGKKEDGISDRDKYMMYIDVGIPVKTLNKYYSEIGKIEGTKNSSGKTISGSKKKAVFNYINNLNLNATQKKILFTKCNSNYGKNYKNEIFNYINSLNISKQRKEEIWKELYE